MRYAAVLLCAACASPPEPPPAAETEFAKAWLARAAPPETTPPRAEEPAPPPPQAEAFEPAALLSLPRERVAELQALAADDAALSDALSQPIAAGALEALALFRSPAVAAARARVEAARAGYAQSADLRDLVALYRSFVRESRVGSRAMDRVPPPPSVDALSAEVVAREVAIARQELRRAAVEAIAAAREAHADAAWLAESRAITTRDVELQESLVAVVRVHVGAGRMGQAALSAFEGRLAGLRAELDALAAQEPAVRARWNRLLSRPDGAPVDVEVPFGEPPPEAGDAGAVVAHAAATRPEHRIARLREERAEIAVRLAETMTLPRFDAAVEGLAPRADFGVKEAQVAEMRARADAAASAAAAALDETRALARGALADVRAARRRWEAARDEVVPAAERALEAAEASYRSGREGYLELLDAARRLLDARLGAAGARRALAHADARLLRAVGDEVTR